MVENVNITYFVMMLFKWIQHDNGYSFPVVYPGAIQVC